MIKEGDKVICIRGNIHMRDTGETITHTCGNMYKVSKYDSGDSSMYISADEYYSPDVYGLWFTLEDTSVDEDYEDYKYFNHYFITLAKWREMQIDTILYENG